jgi:hypothetical protein
MNEARAIVVVGGVRLPRGVVPLVARPLDVAAVHDGADLVFTALGVFVPPAELDAHENRMTGSSGGGQGKFRQGGGRVGLALPKVDAAEGDVIGCHLDQPRAERRAERTGVDDHHVSRQTPASGPVGVSDNDEPGRRTMLAGDAAHASGMLGPSAQDAGNAAGRPDGVVEKAAQIAPGVGLGLVLLGDGCGGVAVGGQQGGQGSVGLCQAGGGNQLPGERRIAAPWHDVLEGDVAMRDQNLSAGKLVPVLRGEVGIMVAGQQPDGSRGLPGKGEDISTQPPGDRGMAGPGVEGVAVENEFAGTGEQGAEPAQVCDAAGAVAEVHVGDDADGRSGGHDGDKRSAAGEAGNHGAGGLSPPRVSVQVRPVRIFFIIAALALAGPALRADRADMIARIHVEAIGGLMRINLLNTLEATGRVDIDGREMRFRLLAERPNRLRMETTVAGRRLVQGTDGVEAPWQYAAGETGGVSRLGGQTARDFAADAEFDDPLVDYAARGYVLDYAGETTIDGRKQFKLLVTRRLVDSYFLLVDAETYFITRRVTTQVRGGLETVRESVYEDFRPVGGVIMPHRIIVNIDGRRLHETVMETVTPNVRVPPGSFAPPEE